VALSDVCGTASLTWPAESFTSNHGIATLQRTDNAPGIDVQTETLDAVMGSTGTVGVLKVDVEGHEASVVSGGAHALADGRIRDILFEAPEGYPSPVSRALEGHGYTILNVVGTLFGPRLGPASAHMTRRKWEAPSLLATVDVDRARYRFAPRGWQILA